eukprot:gnl/Chilomastix_caulleri/1336.p1 GENE.gnl/Chilomastix_caulleri/1336~~gnl/Chilomastix_caulleri/1336.p1  ORF type:complete len:256 (+),score=34.49 gnl/Chilomastix_caulleri/1336:44-811(+)
MPTTKNTPAIHERCRKTSVKYEKLREEVKTYEVEGVTKRELFDKMGLNPAKYYAIKHKKILSEAHIWTDKEVNTLVSLSRSNPRQWKFITESINSQYATELVEEQVKNKFYSLGRSKKYKCTISGLQIPRGKPGRRSVKSTPNKAEQSTPQPTQDGNGHIATEPDPKTPESDKTAPDSTVFDQTQIKYEDTMNEEMLDDQPLDYTHTLQRAYESHQSGNFIETYYLPPVNCVYLFKCQEESQFHMPNGINGDQLF